ncbi:hypothetical protein Gotri_002358 [Gossypium trilobum]|uniref:Uncharacterized protein n=1 Tax=Gossypium trilobum TaxID=34281 RepID=A0A7J9F811_9ROSI|nr:hypothetical protein [Gossypium trilobum]
MKPTKSLIGDSLNLRGKPILENQTTRQIWIYLDHSTLDSMRQGMKVEKNRMRLPCKIVKRMRMIMRQHSSCKIPHPTRHAPSTGRNSHQGYGSGKGKVSIERGHSPRFDDLDDV